MNHENYKPILKIRLIFLFIALCSLILVSVLYANYYLANNMLKKEIEDSSLQQYYQTEYNILNLFKSIDLFSKILIVDDAVKEYLSINTFQDQGYESYNIKSKVYKAFTDIVNINSDIESISIVKNSRVIGVSSHGPYFETESEEFDWLYNTDYYKNADANNRVKWMESTDKDGEYYISEIRQIIGTKYNGQYAYIIINIKENSLRNIYNYRSNNQAISNKTYLVDSSGTIVSDTNKKMINSKYSFFKEIPHDKKSGYFQYQDGDLVKQAIFGEIGDTGLYYISEISLNVLFNNIKVFRNFILVLSGVSFLFSILISFSFISAITKPLDELIKGMIEIEKGNIGTTLKTIPNSEIGIIWGQFNRMSMQVKNLIEKNKKDEEEKRILEIEALQYQINPHFIYNSLNTIKWMSILQGTQNITESLNTMGNILREIFSQKHTSHKIQDEIRYIENYIVMMNYRFGGRIKLSVMIDDTLKDAYIPRFFMQPIIENSIKHGMRESDLYLYVNIQASILNSQIVINITDSGKGMDDQKIDNVSKMINQTEVISDCSIQKSFGLKNVNRRIKLLYGKDFGLVIDRDFKDGTSIKIIIPVNNSQ